MKLRRQKGPTTYKTHFFSALCRSLYVNCSQILVNTLFVKTVGAKSYSQLYFFAGFAALFYFVYFAFRGHNAAFKVYRVVLGLSLLASVLYFLEPFSSPLAPFNVPLLYLFAVSVNVVDLVGPTLGPAILQWSVNPAIFREVYQRIVAAELLARISAAAMVWIVSQHQQLNFCYPISWLVLVLHFVFFNITVSRLRRTERKSKRQTQPSNVSETINKSVQFIISNPLVRAAIAITLWAYSTQFLIEFLFYQTADARFSSHEQYASFLSALTVFMTALALVFQHLVGKNLTKRLQLTTLFSLQPINILIFGCAALFVAPFWPLALLMVTYSTINRSVQLPVSRQCLVPIPRPYRTTIVSLISILAAVCQLLLGGAVIALKGVLHLQDFLVILIVMATLVFLLITRLDAYYIRNLWSLYREARSGRWQDKPVADRLSAAELDTDTAVGAYGQGDAQTNVEAVVHGNAQANAQQSVRKVQTARDVTAHALLRSYATSYNREELAATSQDHRRLLHSGKEDLTLLALKICFISGFPWFKPLIASSFLHDSAPVREFAKLAMEVDAQFDDLQGYTSLFRRRIKTLALEFLEQNASTDYLQKLQTLVKIPNREFAESYLAVLSDARFKDLREVLLRCIDVEETHFSLKPIFDHMLALDFKTGATCRMILQQLAFGQNDALLDTVNTNLLALKRENLCLWADPLHSNQKPNETERFMHTLFIEEFRLYPKELDQAVVDTIGEFTSVSREDSAILIEMHLEWLKKSELFRSWQKLMT
jgi:hypothetical protein